MKIINSAIKDENGQVHVPYFEDSPGRHYHVIRRMAQEGYNPRRGTQGFVTNTGEFLDRSEAARLALENGQVEELATPPYLFSEDLWK